MKYKEYLRSKHWIEFRESIYSVRNRCQRCGKSKKKTILNIHHINYKCLGKETNDDIIVLCQDCHHRSHNAKKWKIAMKKGKDLLFVNKADNSKELFNRSEVLRICNRCGEQHPIFYLHYKKSGLKFMGMACPNSKPRINFIKKEIIEGLPIIERP